MEVWIGCRTRFSGAADDPLFRNLTFAAPLAAFAFFGWSFCFGALWLKAVGFVTFAVTCMILGVLQKTFRHGSLVFSPKGIRFPAGFDDHGSPLETWRTKQIAWSSVRTITGKFHPDATVASITLTLHSGNPITIELQPRGLDESTILIQLDSFAADKLSPDLSIRAKENQARQVQAALDRLAKRSETDARVVALMRQMSAEGRSAAEIMEAIFKERLEDNQSLDDEIS